MRLKIPGDVLAPYSKLGHSTDIYARLRWVFCQFDKIEEHIPKKGVIVDLGCGYGIMANLLSLRSKDRHIIGIDISDKRINIAKKTLRNQGNVEFLLGDINSEELKSCDAIILSDILHHIPFDVQEKVLKKSYEKLQDDGSLLIKEMDKKPRWKFVITYMLDKLLNTRKKLYHRDSEEFKDLLKEIGFTMEKIILHKNTPFTDVLFVCKKERA